MAIATVFGDCGTGGIAFAQSLISEQKILSLLFLKDRLEAILLYFCILRRLLCSFFPHDGNKIKFLLMSDLGYLAAYGEVHGEWVCMWRVAGWVAGPPHV